MWELSDLSISLSSASRAPPRGGSEKGVRVRHLAPATAGASGRWRENSGARAARARATPTAPIAAIPSLRAYKRSLAGACTRFRRERWSSRGPTDAAVRERPRDVGGLLKRFSLRGSWLPGARALEVHPEMVRDQLCCWIQLCLYLRGSELAAGLSGRPEGAPTR